MAQKPPDNTGKKYKRTVYDPRVDMFKQFYLKPDSYTFMNILKSALRAGYSEQYAQNISTQRPQWWVDLVESGDFTRAKMLNEAQNRLYEVVSEPIGDDVQSKKIQVDTSKFVTERLGKEHYAQRTELTDKGGRRLFRSEMRQDANIALHSLFKGIKEQS